MTIDWLDVDLRGVFAPGMTYVALSRGVSCDHMAVRGFRRGEVKTDPRVIGFYRELSGGVGEVAPSGPARPAQSGGLQDRREQRTRRGQASQASQHPPRQPCCPVQSPRPIQCAPPASARPVQQVYQSVSSRPVQQTNHPASPRPVQQTNYPVSPRPVQQACHPVPPCPVQQTNYPASSRSIQQTNHPTSSRPVQQTYHPIYSPRPTIPIKTFEQRPGAFSAPPRTMQPSKAVTTKKNSLQSLASSLASYNLTHSSPVSFLITLIVSTMESAPTQYQVRETVLLRINDTYTKGVVCEGHSF